METIKKDSGSGITFTGEDGQSKTLEEFVQEEEDKEKDRQVEEQRSEVIGFSRRTIYNQPHYRLCERKDHPSGGKVYTQGEINTLFCERNLKLMAQEKTTPLVQLVIGSMADGGWYTPEKIANKILEANPTIKVDASNVSWRMSQLRGSAVNSFVIKRPSEAGRRGFEYSFARCLCLSLSAAEIYGLYTKSNRKITLNSIKEKFPEIATYLEQKHRKDKWSKGNENPVEEGPEVAEPPAKLADVIKRSVGDKLEVEIKVNGRIDFVFGFGFLKGGKD